MPEYSFFVTLILSMFPFVKLYYNLKKTGYTNSLEIDRLHIKVNMLIYDNEQIKTKIDKLLEKKEKEILTNENETQTQREDERLSPIDFLGINYDGLYFNKDDDSDDAELKTNKDNEIDVIQQTNKKSWLKLFY
jgi:hypothetical protein